MLPFILLVLPCQVVEQLRRSLLDCGGVVVIGLLRGGLGVIRGVHSTPTLVFLLQPAHLCLELLLVFLLGCLLIE